MDPTLAISGTFALAVGGIYAWVGYRLAPRHIIDPGSLALAFFATWWFALSLSTIVGALNQWAAAVGVLDLLVFILATHVNLLVVFVGLWGLLAYLAYVFLGHHRMVVGLSVYYVAVYLFAVHYITQSNPVGIRVERWRVVLGYEKPLEGPLLLLLVVLLLVPALVGALGLLALAARSRERAQRLRAALVGSSITLWFGTTLVAAVAGLTSADWWQLASRFLGLAAALVILAAYRPPSWLRQRTGLVPLGAASVSPPHANLVK